MEDSTQHGSDYILREDAKQAVKTQDICDISQNLLVHGERKITKETLSVMQREAEKNGVILNITRSDNDLIIYIES
ncbi:MAG: hypothetical protein U9Q66_00120 [Patescibacteria group bacterium]|nr:hypothetical protein [Patescibacteria group bacterium]